MPDYLQRNALGARADLPWFYWTAETDMRCLREAITQTLEHGYAHHMQRMSNYCAGCRYDPGARVGEEACPFTSLYWDFLARHAPRLQDNQRMRMQLKNLDRLDAGERQAIAARAARIRAGEVGGAYAAPAQVPKATPSRAR